MTPTEEAKVHLCGTQFWKDLFSVLDAADRDVGEKYLDKIREAIISGIAYTADTTRGSHVHAEEAHLGHSSDVVGFGFSSDEVRR